MTLRNYGKQKCPKWLKKMPNGRGAAEFYCKYQENGEFWPKNGLRNYGKLKIPVFLMVSIHCSLRRRAVTGHEGPYLHTGHGRGRDTEIGIPGLPEIERCVL